MWREGAPSLVIRHVSFVKRGETPHVKWLTKPTLLRPAHKSIVMPDPTTLSRESGTLRGTRTVWGGRAQVRAALYMAALVATRYNPAIKTCYQRLCQAGKAKKLALTPCMRKLLTILNAMLKTRTPWREAVAQHT